MLRPAPRAALVITAMTAACGVDEERRVLELPALDGASTVVIAMSFRSGDAWTRATVYEHTAEAEPIVFDHAWNPADVIVASVYLYARTPRLLGLFAGPLDPPPLGREAEGKTLPSPDRGFELVFDESAPSDVWQPATLGLLARYRYFIPELTCPPGQHDGGDHRCVALGDCSPGHRDGGGGTCVPEGSCAPTYYPGREGSCQPACPSGFYATQAGLCCPDRLVSQGGDCVEACTIGQVRAPDRATCVPDSWCCDSDACAPC